MLSYAFHSLSFASHAESPSSLRADSASIGLHLGPRVDLTVGASQLAIQGMEASHQRVDLDLLGVEAFALAVSVGGEGVEPQGGVIELALLRRQRVLLPGHHVA